MPIDPKPLEKSGVDVAGALSEELLNRFAAAHYTHVQNIYSGSYVTDQFESRFEVRYKINKPLKFDLTSLPSSKFEPIWISHMNAKGSRAAKPGAGPIPPTLTIKEDQLVFHIRRVQGAYRHSGLSARSTSQLDGNVRSPTY